MLLSSLWESTCSCFSFLFSALLVLYSQAFRDAVPPVGTCLPLSHFRGWQAGEFLLAGGLFILLQLRHSICRNAEAIRTGRGCRTSVRTCSVDMRDAAALQSPTPYLHHTWTPNLPEQLSKLLEKVADGTSGSCLLGMQISPSGPYSSRYRGERLQYNVLAVPRGLFHPASSGFPTGSWKRCRQEEEAPQYGS